MFIPQFFRGAVPGIHGANWTTVLGGMRTGQSKAGVMVTPETALAMSAVRACVTLLAESVAQLPCELYRRDRNGGRVRATDHPLYSIVHTQPNKKDTCFDYYEQQQGVLGLEGNCYSLIDRDGKGYVTELIPVNPRKVIVLKGPDGMPYYQLPELGEILPMRLIHHVKYFSLDGYVGTSPIQTNADVLGLGLAVEQHAAQVFARGTTMSGVIERPKESGVIKSQEVIDALLAKWTDRYSGLRNMFSVALLQDGMSYKQLSQDNEKAQLLQTRQWTVNEICRLYKVPPHMIQLLDRSTNNNIEHQGLQYVMYTLLAWLKRHESAMMRDLLLPEERSDLYIEFNVSSLLRGDQKSRYESYALGRQWGWLSVNDIRRLENMPPVAGGDTYLTPLNMVNSNLIPGLGKATTQQLHEIESILSHT
ncbi:phage portal protein [Salmonella enterica]|nr:phage portal protein [Salmonella enterica]EBA9765542.1 phage portal protein [Salmonella enterica]EEB5699295.1 phage portal protein [Salmonella enterica]EGX5144521.1 phage portal protein [Salmonella enterica]ELF4900206.1 phage portal protein [Salmonella enterica]